MITDYKFNKTDSLDAKQFFNFLDEMHFDKHAKVKSLRDRNLLKKRFIKTSILASGLRTIFVSENPTKLCEKVKSFKTSWKYFEHN